MLNSSQGVIRGVEKRKRANPEYRVVDVPAKNLNTYWQCPYSGAWHSYSLEESEGLTYARWDSSSTSPTYVSELE